MLVLTFVMAADVVVSGVGTDPVFIESTSA